VKPFQRIIFLIRDWSNPKEHPFGSKGGKKYIKNYLDTTQREEGTELGDRRRQILQLFSKVDCYLMPKPGEKIETDKSDDNSRLSGRYFYYLFILAHYSFTFSYYYMKSI